jgi:anaerobic ribonucleoside-triphosphate reductase activating protein
MAGVELRHNDLEKDASPTREIMPASDKSGSLRIFRRESPVHVLGPYARAVVWVQGCAFHCPNCIVPESWDFAGGMVADVHELAAWVLEQDVEGVTLSGGEPMSQAAGLCALVDELRLSRDIGVMCYTGYTLSFLRERGDEAQQALLDRVDLLIDGVYLADQHADLLWRGSQNQNLNMLTSRYEAVAAELLADHGDKSAGVEVVMDEFGAIGFAGVPAKPGFRDEFVRRMGAHGIRLAIAEPAER